jgi:hypothetical protein
VSQASPPDWPNLSARIVVQYAEAYTAHVDQSFATTILDALRATYPCR